MGVHLLCRLINNCTLLVLTNCCVLMIFDVQIKSLSAMEVNIVRPFVARALQAFQKLGNLVPESDSMPTTRPQEADKGGRGRVSKLFCFCRI